MGRNHYRGCGRFCVRAHWRGWWSVSRAILIAMHWACRRQTAALSSPFIWANSVVGLAGAIYVGQTPSVYTWLYALAALAGAMIGTIVGLRWLSQTTTCYLLAAILCAAGIQLLAF